MLQPQAHTGLSISERDYQRNVLQAVTSGHVIAAISRATMNISTNGFPGHRGNGSSAHHSDLVENVEEHAAKSKPRSKRKSKAATTVDAEDDSSKRRCVSTACIACR
jgi:hypothetical protein